MRTWRIAVALWHARTALAMPRPALAGGGGSAPAAVAGDQETSGAKAKLKANGKAIAPASAPQAVKKAIERPTRSTSAGIRCGGGHSSTKKDNKYDCSGAVSYVLGKKGAGILDSPMASGDFAGWGNKGKGNWITWYGDSGHVFVVIAGLRFDTSMPDDGKSGPGWSKNVRAGFANVSKKAARHKGSL